MSAVFEWRDAIRRPPDGRGLRPTERLVALVLSFYMDRDTLENARPGPARLAAETGLSPRSVKLALNALVKGGWIVQTSKGGTRKGGTEKIASTYRGVPQTSEQRAPVQEIHGSTRAGDSREPVQETTDTRAGDAHHLVLDLAQDLGESAEPDVVDLATSLCSRPATPTDRRAEVLAKLAPIRRHHDDDAVLEQLTRLSDEGYAFTYARELVTELEVALPARSANGTGYVPGHHPSAQYPYSQAPAYDLDDEGNLVDLRRRGPSHPVHER